MKTNIHIISAVLLSVVLQGCSIEQSFSDYVEKVVSIPTDNSLRQELRISFRQDCQYYVEYWQSDNPASKKSSELITAKASQESSYTMMFLYPETEYSCRIVVDNMESQTLSFKTSPLPPDIPDYSVVEADGNTILNGYLMQWEGANPGYVTFCDWDGNVVWYQAYGKAIRTAWYDPASRNIAILMGFQSGDNVLANDPFYRIASDILVSDLCGNIVFSGKASNAFIQYPHHEFRILDDGNYLILHNVVKYGVYGEGFSLVSPEGEILWAWDSFDEINPDNTDYVDADRFANDYIHANSVTRDSNGDYYFTVNRLSELWKIDGKTGQVIYRLGKHGNLSLLNADYLAGGIHAAEIISPDRILCYANGSNTGISSAILYNIDPESMSACVELEIKLPSIYSSNNRSNAQMISDDIYLLSSTMSCKAVFTNADGDILRVIGRNGISYRAYWFDAHFFDFL